MEVETDPIVKEPSLRGSHDQLWDEQKPTFFKQKICEANERFSIYGLGGFAVFFGGDKNLDSFPNIWADPFRKHAKSRAHTERRRMQNL